MQKKIFLYLVFHAVTMTGACFAMNIETGKEMPLTKMEQDGTVADTKNLSDRMSMSVFLVSKNLKGKTVVHEFHARMMQPDITNALNYRADQSINKSLSFNKEGDQIVSDKIFKLAVQDSVQKEFNHFFWEFDSTKGEYTIILPSPYIEGKDFIWHDLVSFNRAHFQTLWKKGQHGIQYYLDAYQKKTWPLRSYSDARRKWGSL